MDVPLHRRLRLRVVKRDREMDDAARDRDPARGVERVVHGPEVVEEVSRRERERVVGHEHRPEAGRGLDQAGRRLLVERVLGGEHEEVEREIELHLAVLDEDRALAGLAIRDAGLAVLARLLRDHRRDRCGHRGDPNAAPAGRPAASSASGASSIPSASSAVRIACAIAGAFGASPWTQMLCA